MSTAQPQAAIREELRLVEEDLARIRETAADLRRRVGERACGWSWLSRMSYA